MSFEKVKKIPTGHHFCSAREYYIIDRIMSHRIYLRKNLNYRDASN